MNPRERVRAAINHMPTDKLPVDFGSTNVSSIHINAYKCLIDQLNIQDSNIKLIDSAQQLVIPCEELLCYFQVDTRPVRLKHSKKSKTRLISENEFLDDWGLVWEKPPSSLYFDTLNSPLRNAKSVAEIMDYQWPSIDTLATNEGVEEEAAQLHFNTQYALIGSFGSSIFMRAQFLRGFDRLFMDMIESIDIFEALLDKILEIRIGLAKLLLDAAGDYLDIIELADDIVGQNGPLFSPEIYRNYIKPRTKTLIDVIKSNHDIKVMYHCCGAVYDFIEDFIEIGVDILNPVQVSALNMDSKKLKQKFGDRIAFHGGIDQQGVLSKGTTSDVLQETNRRIKDFWVNGGYFPFATHNIQPDVSPDNIIAMY